MRFTPASLLRKASALMAESDYSLHRQQEGLGRVLESAYASPYYRELFDNLGLRPKDISDDIRRIPPTDKNTVRKDPSRFLTKKAAHLKSSSLPDLLGLLGKLIWMGRPSATV